MLKVLENNLQLAKRKILNDTNRNADRNNGRSILEEEGKVHEQFIKYIDLKEFSEIEASLTDAGFRKEFLRIKDIIKEIAA